MLNKTLTNIIKATLKSTDLKDFSSYIRLTIILSVT